MKYPSRVFFALIILAAAGCRSSEAAAAVPVRRDGVYHSVRKGETLWRIGKAYSISVDELLAANTPVKAHELKVDDALFVPGGRRVLEILPWSAGKLVKTRPEKYSRRWRYIIIHHSATKTGSARIFGDYHRSRGWKNGLGYHFVISNGTSGLRDGQVEIGPRWKKQIIGAHCDARGMNYVSIGICLTGNLEVQRPTKAQMESLRRLVRMLMRQHNIPASKVAGHGNMDRGSKCPGKNFPLSGFRRDIANAR